jgi:hypothetical protein
VLLEAGRLAQRAGDAPRMAMAALANGRGWQSDAGGIDHERVAALEAALDALGDADPKTRALLLVRLAVETVYEPDSTRRMALAEEATAVARAVGDPATIFTVLSSSHNVLLSHKTVEQRRRNYEEMRRIAETSTDPNIRFGWPGNGYFWRLQTRDIEGARADVALMEEGARAMRQPMLDWIVAWMNCAFARIDGDIDETVALLDRALEIGSGAGIPDALVFDGIMRGSLLIDLAEPASRGNIERLCAQTPEHYPGVRLQLVMFDIAIGQGEADARARLDAFAASPRAPWSEFGGQPDSTLIDAAHFAGCEAALGVSSPWTRAAYEFLDPWRGQLFGNITWYGPVESYLAAIAPLAGHADDLDELVETTVRYCDEMGAPIITMCASVFAACGLRLRDRPGDRALSSELIESAIAIGDRVGAGFARAAADGFPSLRP